MTTPAEQWRGVAAENVDESGDPVRGRRDDRQTITPSLVEVVLDQVLVVYARIRGCHGGCLPAGVPFCRHRMRPTYSQSNTYLIL